MATADSLTPRRRRWHLARGLLRAIASLVFMVVLYYTLPLGALSDLPLAVELSVGLALLAGVIKLADRGHRTREVPRHTGHAVSRGDDATVPAHLRGQLLHPQRRRRGDLHREPGRSDALYLTVTIFATVGFGDISAQTESARLFVTVQMLLDLVVLGLGLQVFLGAVKRGKASPDEPDA